MTSETRKITLKDSTHCAQHIFFFFHFIKFFFSNQTFSVISKYLCRFINLHFCNLVQNFYSILYKDREKNKSLWVQGYRCKIRVSCILLQIGCQLAHMNQDLKLFLIWMRRLTQLNFATYNPEIKETTFNYRKVASSRPVYYSIFDHFWGATNQDVLLSKTCYYCHVNHRVHKRCHEFNSIFVKHMLHIIYVHKS